MNLAISWQIFEKSSHFKFHENPPSGSRVVLCGQTAHDEVTVALSCLANAPKNGSELIDANSIDSLHSWASIGNRKWRVYGSPWCSEERVDWLDSLTSFNRPLRRVKNLLTNVTSCEQRVRHVVTHVGKLCVWIFFLLYLSHGVWSVLGIPVNELKTVLQLLW